MEQSERHKSNYANSKDVFCCLALLSSFFFFFFFHYYTKHSLVQKKKKNAENVRLWRIFGVWSFHSLFSSFCCCYYDKGEEIKEYGN